MGHNGTTSTILEYRVFAVWPSSSMAVNTHSRAGLPYSSTVIAAGKLWKLKTEKKGGSQVAFWVFVWMWCGETSELPRN